MCGSVISVSVRELVGRSTSYDVRRSDGSVSSSSVDLHTESVVEEVSCSSSRLHSCISTRSLSLHILLSRSSKSLSMCPSNISVLRRRRSIATRVFQVCWYWKFLSETDQIWMPKCLRFGWTPKQSATAYESTVWKRVYSFNIQALQTMPVRVRSSERFSSGL